VTRLDERFEGMGTTLRVLLEDDEPGEEPSPRLRVAGELARATLVRVERALTRFDPASELCRLNADPRPELPAGQELRRLVAAGRWAGERTGGLVDITVVDALEAQGYAGALPPRATLAGALRSAPRRRPAAGDPAGRWRELKVRGGAVQRPPGVRIDSGGLGKGLAADLAVAAAGPDVRALVSCGGDIAVGGGPRQVWVRHPLSGELCHPFTVAGGVATSSIHRRLWRRSDGAWAHHVIDPSTGEPAWTGLVAATALGVDGLEAEALATAALLSGPLAARRVLRGLGGLLVHERGDVELIEPAPRLRARRRRAAVSRRPPWPAA
jgi:FAD:protein FMN transferase